MRAIPVEVPAVVPIGPLPRTLPADAKVVYNQCAVDAPVIAITFDDGPHPENTPRLLAMLKERNIKATFFMVGQCVVAYPHVVKQIADEGHEVANHSWSHPNLAPMKDTRIMEQLQKTHDAIVSACGVAPILYRPPYGSIRMTQRKAIHDKFGYPTILWDVDPQDWQTPRTAAKVQTRVLAQTKPGSIILCHDIHKPTIDAMPAVLDELLARGYKFVTVTELINLDSQTALQHAALATEKAGALPSSAPSPVASTVPTTPAPSPAATTVAPAPAPATAPVAPTPSVAAPRKTKKGAKTKPQAAPQPLPTPPHIEIAPALIPDGSTPVKKPSDSGKPTSR